MRGVRQAGRPQARWGGLARAVAGPTGPGSRGTRSGQGSHWTPFSHPPHPRRSLLGPSRGRWVHRRTNSWLRLGLLFVVLGAVGGGAATLWPSVLSGPNGTYPELLAVWRGGQQLAIRLFHQFTPTQAATPAFAPVASSLVEPDVAPPSPGWPSWFWRVGQRWAARASPRQVALMAAVPGFGVYLERTGGGVYGLPAGPGQAGDLQVVRRDSLAGAGGEWPPPGADALLPIDPRDLAYEKETPGTLPGASILTPPSPSPAVPRRPTEPSPPAVRGDETSPSDRPVQSPSAPSRPVVWVYHTHSAESYHSTGRQSIAEHYDWNSTHSGVMQVGEELVKVLNQEGIAAWHDQTINDYPSFGQAYENSRHRLKEVLRKHPSVRLVVDIHRDGTNYAGRAVTVAGQVAAKVGLVVAGDEYLSNPQWRENLFFAQKLDAKLREEYPGISRGIIPRMDARFNQDLLQPALLLEIGTYTNGLAEAKRTARFVGQALAEVLSSS